MLRAVMTGPPWHRTGIPAVPAAARCLPAPAGCPHPGSQRTLARHPARCARPWSCSPLPERAHAPARRPAAVRADLSGPPCVLLSARLALPPRLLDGSCAGDQLVTARAAGGLTAERGTTARVLG